MALEKDCSINVFCDKMLIISFQIKVYLIINIFLKFSLKINF